MITGNDGKRASLTTPNSLSQARLIQQALLDAQINSSDVRLVEAHGTGAVNNTQYPFHMILFIYYVIPLVWLSQVHPWAIPSRSQASLQPMGKQMVSSGPWTTHCI